MTHNSNDLSTDTIIIVSVCAVVGAIFVAGVAYSRMKYLNILPKSLRPRNVTVPSQRELLNRAQSFRDRAAGPHNPNRLASVSLPNELRPEEFTHENPEHNKTGISEEKSDLHEIA